MTLETRDLMIPNFADVEEARRRIEGLAHKTPTLRCSTLDRLAGAALHFKCENFQKAGAFKFRGACNAVFSLNAEQAERGVTTHSSGNHAGALSLAAALRGISATIVMPTNAPKVKRAAVEGYGGKIVWCEPTQAAREETTARIVAETGAVMIHPYDDARIVAGQATAAWELLEEVGPLDAILAPVGGGGLLSGTVLSTKRLSPGCRVIGAEPLNADDAYHSLLQDRIVPVDRPNTVADGLRTSLGKLTFAVIRDGVDEIVRVSEAEIVDAMRLVWERMKIVIEPSSAVPVAVAVFRKIPLDGRRVGVLLSGGNVDLDGLAF